MRKYTSDVKANGKDSSELDPCLAARSREKRSLFGRWKKWVIIGVLLFFLLLAITLGLLVFFLFSSKATEPAVEYVHHELESPPDYDAEDIEAAAMGSRSLQYNRHKHYKTNNHLVFQPFGKKELAYGSREEIPKSERKPMSNPILTEVTATASTFATANVVQTNYVTKTAANTSTLARLHLEPISSSTSSTTTTTTTRTTTTQPSPTTSTSELKLLEREKSVEASSKPMVSNEVKKDCSVHIEAGGVSGVYLISPDGADAFPVYCDQETVGGGWTVIQRRISGSVYFYNRTWLEYEEGFGDIHGSHWLGLAKIYRLAPREGDSWTLRIELQGDFCSGRACLNQKNGSWWAEWPFKLGGASTGYVLEIGAATAGNLTSPGSSSFLEKFNNGRKFTTIDKDNDNVQDVNCAQFRNFGGWWHGDCGYIALNGLYNDTAPQLRYMVYTYSDGHRKFFVHPMKSVMMIRPGSSSR